MRLLIKAIEYIVIAMMAVVVAVVFGEVVMRGLFGISLVITEELGRYLMIWTAMMAVALVADDDGHIRITLLADSLPPRAAHVMAMLSDLVALAFLALLSATSLRQLPEMVSQGTVTLGISMAWIYASIPIGGLLTMIVVVARCVRRLRQAQSSARDGAVGRP